MSEEPQKPDIREPIRLWNRDSIRVFTERAAAWLGEVELTQEIKEPLMRTRTPFQENDEVVPNWTAVTSGDWVAMKQLKQQLYERRGE